jgi:hypothetical protein
VAQDDDHLDDQASRPDPFEREDKGSLFSPVLDESRLPQDYGPPTAPPDDVKETIPKSHQETDSNIQAEEVYDEGLTGAIDIDAQEEGDGQDLPELRVG